MYRYVYVVRMDTMIGFGDTFPHFYNVLSYNFTRMIQRHMYQKQVSRAVTSDYIPQYFCNVINYLSIAMDK